MYLDRAAFVGNVARKCAARNVQGPAARTTVLDPATVGKVGYIVYECAVGQVDDAGAQVSQSRAVAAAAICDGQTGDGDVQETLRNEENAAGIVARDGGEICALADDRQTFADSQLAVG